MAEEVKIDLKEVYILLQGTYKEIKKYSYEESLSDIDFFKYGIYADIFSNGLSAVINLMLDNEETIGIDNNCRAIIEAFAILKMDENNYIDETQKKMYRLSYSSVEYANRKKLFNKLTKEERENSQFFKDYKKLKDIACSFYDCKKTDLRKTHKLDDPRFYLTKELNERCNIREIVKKNNFGLEGQMWAYDLFSSMIHPRLETQPDIENNLMLNRRVVINLVLQEVINFAFKINLATEEDLKEVVWPKNILEKSTAYQSIVNHIKNICESVIRLIGNDCGPIIQFFFKKAEHLFIDMFYCYILGYDEMVTPKFKSFLELDCVACYLSTLDDGESVIKTLGFLCASRLRFFDYYQDDFKKGVGKILDDELQSLYDGYYKRAYGFDDFSTFKEDLKENALYALSKPTMSFLELVKSTWGSELDKESYDHLVSIYKTSIDMEHGSGYTFNKMSYYTEMDAVESMRLCLCFIDGFLRWLAPNLDEYYDEFDLRENLQFLHVMMGTFLKMMDDINNEYGVKIEKEDK